MRDRLLLLGEFIYVIDALVVVLVAGLIVISGVNPLDSPALLGVLAVTVIVFAAHHVWYARHREEIERDPARLAARERRGY